MKISPVFLLLSATLAHGHKGYNSYDAPAAQATGSYVPLFDFELAPYNVALEIVAEALEKLADTMEPLDVPLPLIGPEYYLEVMVKSTKKTYAPRPDGQINPISIEGGEAPLVTEIDIILPGESVVHQTIVLPVDGGDQPRSTTESNKVSENPVTDIAVPALIPSLELQTDSAAGALPNIESTPAAGTEASEETLSGSTTESASEAETKAETETEPTATEASDSAGIDSDFASGNDATATEVAIITATATETATALATVTANVTTATESVDNESTSEIDSSKSTEKITLDTITPSRAETEGAGPTEGESVEATPSETVFVIADNLTSESELPSVNATDSVSASKAESEATFTIETVAETTVEPASEEATPSETVFVIADDNTLASELSSDVTNNSSVDYGGSSALVDATSTESAAVSAIESAVESTVESVTKTIEEIGEESVAESVAKSTLTSEIASVSVSQETGNIPEIIGGTYGSSVSAQEESLSNANSASTAEEGTLDTDEIAEKSSGVSPAESDIEEISADVSLEQETSSAPGSFELITVPSNGSTPSSGYADKSTETYADVAKPVLTEADDISPSAEAFVDTNEVTMVRDPLPYPPFGGPQQQIPSQFDEGELPAASPTKGVAPELIAATNGLVQSIDIINADNENMLESSIGAILHSVIEDYKTQSNPKAAIGFAIIHARREATAAGDYI
ncbi:hypothetical protein LPJ66_008029 [Kickxella alabastrina]|uniref:Uncharacterized protein n=1 Tax=Kickxella alabastrina TaxID=61397 RepID=A0ACC1IB05_9FUNG|nr:hypothetical protein LPJ66_008029 [Kickxella alabastrina]